MSESGMIIAWIYKYWVKDFVKIKCFPPPLAGTRWYYRKSNGSGRGRNERTEGSKWEKKVTPNANSILKLETCWKVHAKNVGLEIVCQAVQRIVRFWIKSRKPCPKASNVQIVTLQTNLMRFPRRGTSFDNLTHPNQAIDRTLLFSWQGLDKTLDDR
jgi:hypothetical protein